MRSLHTAEHPGTLERKWGEGRRKIERKNKREEEGRMVACLRRDRAPKGSRVVCVCVWMHMERKVCVPLQGRVSAYVGEGGGRAGGHY